MNARILLIDDEPDLLEIVSMNLNAEGYIVKTVRNASEAISSIKAERPDLILLDIMLPDMSGIKLTGKLKNNPDTASIPIILLTAKDTETDVVVGLSVGADDYITKPFSNQVLVARIEAVLRRAYPDMDDIRESISVGSARIIPSARQVFVEGKSIDLTGGEFSILLALAQAGGDVMSREQLKDILPGSGRGEKERIVDVHVAALRKKLGPARNIVKTVHGQGYRIEM